MGRTHFAHPDRDGRERISPAGFRVAESAHITIKAIFCVLTISLAIVPSTTHKMKIITWFIWCLVALVAKVSAGGGGGKHHVKYIIKYPVKTIKHTHTIYKTIYHKPESGGDGGLGHSHGGKPFSFEGGWH
ncbi:hypothetical protein Zmor_008183 [Zophobas morio]|uniref:Uncharacterized protein n=1 Tax=Zophobas morio TaxID=2755281 RepID=A0AA38IXB2_9CUCU|nr:hypothetical protein Zmor_008183 [Zophobas morio]